MTMFGRIALGCAVSLVSLVPLDPAGAASNSPNIIVPPRSPGSVQCDTRGCFGFGPQQWYRRPGQPIPNTPQGLDGRPNLNPRIYIQPRNTYVPPKRPQIRSPNDNQNRHQIWCADRYRSYNPATNRYTSLHHGFQTCHSPWG
ncbi:MAG: BA14K family protein [Rhizobiaceae bacterium]|nr:BA14K family protein [Rhizobiaceae bacterium]